MTARIARVLSAPRPKRTAAWAAAVALCLAALSPEAAASQEDLAKVPSYLRNELLNDKQYTLVTRLLYTWQAAAEAARVGARYAAVCDDTTRSAE